MRKLSLVILSLLVVVFLSAKLMSDSPHGKDFNLPCELCHSSKSWKLDKSIYAFDHNKTAFALTGEHQSLDCRICHPTLVFSDAKTSCIDCHTDMHNQTVGPDCGRCHTTKSWIVENITEIHQRSRFPLLGPHYTTDCSVCHKSASLLRFEPLGTLCYDCHQANYESAKNPDHVKGNFSTDCSTCHSVTSFTWTSLNVNHDFFPLVQGHANLDCSRCHTSGSFDGLSPVCVSCHQATYDATTNPNHSAAKIPTSCSDCHTLNPGWKPATFTIHDTYYALTGKHATISCDQCHNGNYSTPLPITCVGCHQADYNNTNNPNHAAAQFGTDCQTCHNTSAWIPSTFDHDNKYFPIYSGKHQGTWTLCTDCHTTPNNYGVFSCIDCHAHNKTDMDNAHSGVGGYEYNSLACYSCHPTGSTSGAFNHNNTGFTLTGAHTTVLCSACHTNGFPGTPTACSACHINAYNQTTNPNHSSIGIATNCDNCHTTNPGWKPATFPTHNNYWALTGAHTSITNCDQCHNGNYNTTPNTCVGCHQNNYNNTNNPSHTSLGLSTSCETCHTTNPGWSPALFPNHNNYWALTGAHASITNCDLCHNGNYNTAPTTCIGCHQNDYNQTTNPPHASAQYPTDCQMCHTTTAWIPSTFNHDGQYFPIYSGHHAGTWSLCSDCHTDPNNYAVFSCITCHAHNQTDMDNAHQGVSGYTYNSQACYNCHPNGSAGNKLLKPKKIDKPNQNRRE